VFLNYLKTAIRNVNKYRGYSFINIFGLAAGITCVILILMWIQDEISYDRFHPNAANIYRVALADDTYQPVRNYPVTPPALSKALRSAFPEIEAAITFDQIENMLVRFKEASFREHVGFVTAEIFDIFSIPFLKGDPQTALQNPYSILITAEIAEKLFGSQEPINSMITIDNQFTFTVSGVIQNIPSNSYFDFGCLVRYDHLKELTGRGDIDSWNDWGSDTFILLNPHTNIAPFSEKIADFAAKSHTYEWKPRLFLQPLTNIHIRDINGGGIITYIYIFIIIAGFILLIACINFMNLATARSALRAKEIGLRKVVGATKSNLILQFYSEALITVVIALLVSLLMVELLLPAFNELTGKQLVLNLFINRKMLLLLTGIALVSGIISGSYPALYLSSIQPISALKGSKVSGSSFMRKILVVFQFLLSTVLIIATITIYNQMHFLRNQSLGFNKEQIVYVPMNRVLKSKYTSVKNELLQNSHIQQVTATSSKLGIRSYGSFDINQWEGNDGEQSILINIIFADFDFPETFDISIAEGRYFDPAFASDSDAVILNRTAVREMGLSNPIGTKIFGKIPIIGIINDFNFQSLRTGIKPLALFMESNEFHYMAVKIEGQNIPAVLKTIETVTQKFTPDFPFEYQFLDEEFNNLYQTEARLGKIFNYSAILTVIISCLGLYGLAAFLVSRRTKEIGIRKTIGATVSNIVLLISAEFIKWVAIANLIAWPIAGFIMRKWLETFAYRVNLQWWVFICAGTLALLIAIVTVSYQSIKAAIADPVDSLRYE
jgi:ABC-type antimicrobial peptide transport system permease subunit